MTAKPLHTVYRTTETENGKETIRKKVSFQPILKKLSVEAKVTSGGRLSPEEAALTSAIFQETT